MNHLEQRTVDAMNIAICDDEIFETEHLERLINDYALQ